MDHVPHNIYDLAVAPDGTVFTDVNYEEGGYESTQFNPDGKINKRAMFSHGGNYGGMAVACNSNYVFIAVVMALTGGSHSGEAVTPAPGHRWYGVSRRQKSNLQLGAPFAGGKGRQQSRGLVLENSFLVVNDVTPATVADVVGLAANDSRLYIANAYKNTIHVYNSSSMAFVTNWSVPCVYRLTLDADGNVWVIQRGTSRQPPIVRQYNPNGILTGRQIAMASNANPVSVTCDSTNFLVVADDGPDENIKYYSFTNLSGSPAVVARMWGTNLMSGPGTNIGRAGPGRFYGLTAVGVDTNHNVYVSWNYDGAPDGLTNQRMLNGKIVDGSLTRSQGVLQKLDAGGNLLWSDYGLNYVDCAAMDPASETDFYGTFNHYKMNWSNPAPGGQWSLAGVTYNRFLYPHDPRVSGHQYQSIVRHLNGGRTYLYCCEQNANVLAAFRFDGAHQGETAIPCALFCKSPKNVVIPNLPADSESLWYDKNGDGIMQANEYETPVGGVNVGGNTHGWYVDAGGDVWETVNGPGPGCGLRRYRLQGFDTNQTPVYSYSHMDVYPVPPPFLNLTENGLERVFYDQSNDIMYLGGYTAQYGSSTWGAFRVLARYNDWGQGNRVAAWTRSLPYDTQAKIDPNSFEVAGAFIFVSSYADHAKISVYHTSDGSFAGCLTPNNGLFDDYQTQTGCVDCRPFGLHVYLLSNGQYLVTVEDDFAIKTVVYLWQPALPVKAGFATRLLH